MHSGESALVLYSFFLCVCVCVCVFNVNSIFVSAKLLNRAGQTCFCSPSVSDFFFLLSLSRNMLSGWLISPCDENTKVLLLTDCDESVPRSVNRLPFYEDSKTLFFHVHIYENNKKRQHFPYH